MGLFFGKSEAELKKIAEELERRQLEIQRRETSLDSFKATVEHAAALLSGERDVFENERAAFRKASEEDRVDLASEKAKLETLRIELTKLQAEAKVGFVEQQRDAFREVVEKQMVLLDARGAELQSMQEALNTRWEDLRTAEGEIAQRELGVTEREQKADAGFADRAKAMADEAARQHKANRAEAERLKVLAEDLAQERLNIESSKAELVSREAAVVAAEQRRDTGFVEARAEFESQMREKRAQIDAQLGAYREQQIAAVEHELAALRKRRLEETTKAEQIERERIRNDLAAERDTWEKRVQETRKSLEAERTQLEQSKGALSALQSELEGRQVEQNTREKVIERKEQRFEHQHQQRSDRLTEEIDARMTGERLAMTNERQELNQAIVRLRDSLRIQEGLVNAFSHLKQQLGDHDPADVIREINSKSDELKRLREELASRPTEEMRSRYQALESEAKNQKARADHLAKQIAEKASAFAEVADLRLKSSELEAENRSLKNKANIFEGAANQAQAELARLRAAYERPAEVTERYKEIELPHITADRVEKPSKEQSVDEITWLTGVGKACDHYGLHFHPRILKAFHTALKTSEWSPVTILAGVSGTGKSELPRLYSHFGGIVFEPLSVQPNWDSQESMLGFFNSIDNKFDAQPILRFLAQSQKKWVDKGDDNSGYPGLEDAVCLVLLDEMNLAHPELYFAEFLSKLELRRGMKGSDVPKLPVKIGAGMPAYQLPLGRNVLWTGTMNQDETTKSLSDKVLDRSIIIHFPRPTELKRRLTLSPLDQKNRGPVMHKKLWNSWLSQKSAFSEEEIKPFKCFIEDMNKALAVAGRAIGHRVWQSIEYYMSNYPDVTAAQRAQNKSALDEALHVAFEDQLVQKVMPKLRGIDTRGKSMTDCLEKIRDQISLGIAGNPFNLTEDFNLACELGYGQFIWQSANYLKEEQAAVPPDATKSEKSESGAAPTAGPPKAESSSRATSETTTGDQRPPKKDKRREG